MKKHVYGRKFKRDGNERKALFKGLITSLVLQEKIHTTEQKAKAIKADVDKLITKAKKGGIHGRQLISPLVHPMAVDKLMNDLGPRFKDRQGGYTRIVRLGRRFNDNATMVLMEWVDRPVASTAIAVVKEPKVKKTKVVTEKKEAAVKVAKVKPEKVKKVSKKKASIAKTKKK